MKKNNFHIRVFSLIFLLALSNINAKSAVLNYEYTLSKTDTLNPKVVLATANVPVTNIENADKDETVILEYVDGVLIKLIINGISFTGEELTSFKENQELINVEMEALKQERETIRREAAEVKKEAENVRREINELLKLREQTKVKSE